jgi:hypothetical protein
MKSFFTTKPGSQTFDTKYLPVLSALYDSLVDDDDEVREAAAHAASRLIGTPAVAPTAADALVTWLRAHFGESTEFASRVVCRMVGQRQPYSYPAAAAGGGQLVLVPTAEEQLRRAMDFDDSLFAAEEQNLFVDEVRETARWRGAFEGLSLSSSEASVGGLRTWVRDGLRCLIGLAEAEDSPLGWTSDQHVFAVCARVLMCAVAISRTGQDGDSGVVGLLREFRAVGERGRVHGSLLEMAELENVA